MALDPLVKHYSMTNPASVYDEEAMTALELAGRTANKVNQCVQAFNIHEDAINQDVAAFKKSVSVDMADFKNNVVETTEDFKDHVDNEIDNINNVIVDKLGVRTVYDYTTGAGKHPDTPPVYVDGGRIYVTPGVYYTASGAYTLTFATNMLIPTTDTAQTLYLLLRPSDENGVIVQLRTLNNLKANDMVICSAYVLTSGATTLSNDSLFSRYYTKSVEQQLPQYRKKVEDAVPGYVVSGAITIDTQNKTIAVTEKLTVTAPTGKNGYRTVSVNTSAPRAYTLPSGYIGTFRITVADDGNYLDYGTYQVDGNETIYLGSYYYGKLCGGHFSPDVKITIDGVEHLAGNLSDTADFVPEAISNAIRNGVETGVKLDLVAPAVIDTIANSEIPMVNGNFSVDRDVEIATDCTGFDINFSRTDSPVSIGDYDPGDVHRGEITLYKNGIKQDTKNVTVRFWGVDNAPTGKKNILVIGDSLIDNSYTPVALNTMFQDFDIDPNFIGTVSPVDGAKHEGHSGWSFNKFVNQDVVNGVTNPLRMDGELSAVSVQEYLAGLGVSTVDYIFICLGVNDVNWGAMFDDSNIGTVIENAKELVRALLDGVYLAGNRYPFIGVTLVPTGNSHQHRKDVAPSAMHRRHNQLNHALIETFDNGVFDSNVTTIPVHLALNKNDDYDDAIHLSDPGATTLCAMYTAKALAVAGGEL